MTVATGETKMVPALLSIVDDRAKTRSVAVLLRHFVLLWGSGGSDATKGHGG